ncbi:MAG: MFS transporter [Acetilactobacillus jinshanensis]
MTTMSDNKIPKKMLGAIIAPGIMSFCGVVVETAMNVAFPDLIKQFHISVSTVQWMTTIYLLIVAMVVPLSAILKRTFRNRALFLTANIAFIVGLVIDMVAPAFWMLLLGRVIQGIGTGIALPLMFNIILEQVPKSQVGMMMGVGCLITGIAPAVGPTYGGVVNSFLSWRWIFVFLIPILLFSLVMGMKDIRQVKPTKRAKFDVKSVIEIFITFISLVYGFSEMGKIGTSDKADIACISPIILGVFVLGSVIDRSMKIKHPVIQLKILKNKTFLGHLSGFFSLQFLTLGLSFVLPNYIQIVNGGNSLSAGLLILPGASICAALAPFGGRILDKFGARKPILFGNVLCLIAMMLFVATGTHLADWMIASFYGIFMTCIGISFGNIMTSGISYLNVTNHADGNAVFTTLQQLSGAMGTSVVSAIINHAQLVGGASKVALTVKGSESAFVVMTFIVMIGCLPLYKVVGGKGK